MVNINGPDEQSARAVGERGSQRSRRLSRSHHVSGARHRRGREVERFREPIDLAELEHLARHWMSLMKRYGSPSPENFHKAIDFLRQRYNMNFIMMCGKCSGSHGYDELTAPER